MKSLIEALVELRFIGCFRESLVCDDEKAFTAWL